MSESRAMTIGLFTDGPAFDGTSLDHCALGGSETALIQAARSLAERGHQVTVFNNCARPGRHDDVLYLPWRSYARLDRQTFFDVFIVSRFFGFFQVPIRAGLRVLWNHDTLERPDDLRQLLGRIDLVFCLSQFHRDQYLSLVPELQGRVLITRNGVDLSLIDRVAGGAKRDPNKVLYASRPERGLKVLLEDIWPKLSADRPGLTLALCGYSLPDQVAPPALAELYRYLNHLAQKTPGVVQLGALTKDTYYAHLAEAALMAYPCTFPEISCIAALEAQACRTPIVTTDGFALSETVQIEAYKVDGRPGAETYNRRFIERARYLLDHPGQAAAWAEEARAAMEKAYTWPGIAAEWERIFALTLRSRKRLEPHPRPMASNNPHLAPDFPGKAKGENPSHGLP
jgi:glycosyltransferase involved in cell wall biosynthesis